MSLCEVCVQHGWKKGMKVGPALASSFGKQADRFVYACVKRWLFPVAPLFVRSELRTCCVGSRQQQD